MCEAALLEIHCRHAKVRDRRRDTATTEVYLISLPILYESMTGELRLQKNRATWDAETGNTEEHNSRGAQDLRQLKDVSEGLYFYGVHWGYGAELGDQPRLVPGHRVKEPVSSQAHQRHNSFLW